MNKCPTFISFGSMKFCLVVSFWTIFLYVGLGTPKFHFLPLKKKSRRLNPSLKTLHMPPKYELCATVPHLLLNTSEVPQLCSQSHPVWLVLLNTIARRSCRGQEDCRTARTGQITEKPSMPRSFFSTTCVPSPSQGFRIGWLLRDCFDSCLNS